ncbi:hypothetical protein EO246_10195 [Lactococcus lactis]|uniref:Uncharacterized protein n=1 Tax=Lactococcus lactis TaxID=1358 RepID=A0A3S3MKH2_9LACT|nr:hypothetical protein EO246_10195 [Lactococcus lactis]
MISLTMSREDWRTGSIPELPLLRMQNKFNERRIKWENHFLKMPLNQHNKEKKISVLLSKSL